LALVARAHHLNDREGAEAVVGSIMADKALDQLREMPSARRPISTWAFLPQVGKKAPYFQNKEGGFGQYYKATLSELGLIGFTDEPPGVRLVRGLGTEIAEICDSQPGRDKFWRAVLADSISFKDVKALAEHLCPCMLPWFHKERDFLRQLLFGAAAKESDEQTRRRASSLCLLISYLNQFPRNGDPWEYRQTAYFGHGPSKKRFGAPVKLNKTRSRWAIYQAGEYINRALEEILVAVLKKIQEGGKAVDSFAADFANDSLALSSRDLGLSKRRKPWANCLLGDLIAEATAGQGSASDWATALWSEYVLTGRAAQETDPRRKTALALGCILSVLARGAFPVEPYTIFETLEPGFGDHHLVNLASVARFLRERQHERAWTVLATLVREKVLFQHLRVAMRKLRYQVQATFKFVIEYGHYVWVENFEPTFTSARLWPAFLFLRDLGLAKGKSGDWGLTGDGRAILRELNGRQDIPTPT
jgi:hypothetical protein